VTVKDELHALVDRLAAQDAHEALDYLRARIEPSSRPTRAFIDESQRALDEATAPGAARVPHEAVREWLRTWGTPEEDEADARLRALEGRPRGETPGASA